MEDAPEDRFLRLTQIVGRKAKKKKNIPAIPAIIPISKTSWLSGVKKGRSMDKSKDVDVLEKRLQEAETAVQEIFKAGKIPTPEDYAGVDRTKAALKVARRIKAMNAKRTDPKLTRKVTILLPEDEFQALTEKAAEEGVDLSKYIRMLLKNRS